VTENDRQVKVGVAGLGRSGWDIHVSMIRQLPEKYQIVAVADLLPERREEAATQIGCRTYDNFDQLLEDAEVELVVVAVPSYLHSEYAIKALKAGKAVVCEKPMATSLEKADEMIAVAKVTGSTLAPFQNRRYSPDFREVRRVIDSGVLGRIVTIRLAYHAFKRRWDWQTLQEFGGGSLNNTCPHPIDRALALMGDKTPQVFCKRDRVLTLGDADDYVKIVLSAEGAPTIEIEVTDNVAYPQPAWFVAGTRGGLSGSTKKLDWRFVRQQEFPPREVDKRSPPDRGYNKEDLVWHEGSWDLASDETPGELGYYIDLYDCLTKGAPLPIDLQTVRRQMWVMEECRRQAPLEAA